MGIKGFLSSASYGAQLLLAVACVVLGGASQAQPAPSDFSAPSSAYVGRVLARIRPNLAWAGSSADCRATTLSLKLSPSGGIEGASVVSSSGDPSWDDAALTALRRTDSLPRDTDGRVPAQMLLRLSNNDDRECARGGRADATAASTRVRPDLGSELRLLFAQRVGEAARVVQFVPGSSADIVVTLDRDGRISGVERVAETQGDRRWSAAVLLSALRIEAVPQEIAQASRKWLLRAESSGLVRVQPLETRLGPASP